MNLAISEGFSQIDWEGLAGTLTRSFAPSPQTDPHRHPSELYPVHYDIGASFLVAQSSMLSVLMRSTSLQTTCASIRTLIASTSGVTPSTSLRKVRKTPLLLLPANH